MKLSLLSFNIARHLELPDMLSLAKEKGFEGVEFRADAQHMHGVELDASPDRRAEIKKMCEDSGLAVAWQAPGTPKQVPKK